MAAKFEIKPKGTAVNFAGILREFSEAIVAAFDTKNPQLLRQVYDSFDCNTDGDRKSPMDQAFREMLLLRICGDVPKVGELISLSIAAARAEIASVTIPVVLLGDIFESVTLDKCEQIFEFVEEHVSVWKEEIFFTSCKNNILRMCNDLLRRLSRAQNTVFCGRILLFLAKFFPFSERSGLNIVSEFNLDNVTEYGVDGKEQDDDGEESEKELPLKIDYNLYCKFWSLQDFFRNPNQCYNKAHWKMFQAHASCVLEAFAGFKLEEPRNNEKKIEEGSRNSNGTIQHIDTDVEDEMEVESCIRNNEHFFAKFLTNQKLLALQLSDSNFRRSVLVQFLILYQYLQLVVKFKNEAATLTPQQTEFITTTEKKVYQLLEETPPNGSRFARAVKHMLTREEMWNNWKNEGCKEFKRPESEDQAAAKPPAKRLKRSLGECLRDANRNGKFFLGNDVLTRLWNYSPDNLQACKSEERNFLPPLETYLENEKGDPSFEWRGLRLLARQSPHFFTFVGATSYKISDYLEVVRKRIVKDRIDMLKYAQEAAAGGPQHEMTSENVEQESVALQDNEAEQDDEEEQAELEKVVEEQNTHSKPISATRENIEEFAPLIGDEWKKLGKKLGYSSDELLYFETEHTEKQGGCIALLVHWFAEDDDASLDNLAYILEGLDMEAASNAVKALIDKLTSSNTAE